MSAAAVRKPKAAQVPGSAGLDGIRWNSFNSAGDLSEHLWEQGKVANGEELAFMLKAWRATWGNPEIAADDKPDAFTPYWSARQIAAFCRCSIDQAQRLSKRLRDAGLVETDPKSDKGGKPLRYRLRVENWHRVAEYVPPTIAIMPAPADESDDEPAAADPAENSADERQQTFDGMEAFIAPKKPVTVGIHRQVDGLRVESDEPIRYSVGFKGLEMRVQIQHGFAENAGVTGATSARTCGGQKLSDAQFLRAVMAGLAERELEVERSFASQIAAQLGREREAAFLAYAFEVLDEKLAKAAKARKRYRREWLPDWARTAAERWTQKRQRAANTPAKNRQNSAGERCPDCGERWADGCRCVAGVGTKGRAS